jgi:Tol biopolymer transport system component
MMQLDRVTGFSPLPLLLTAVLLSLSPAKELQAQDIPIVEPPLSRLYGADDLDFSGLFVSGAVSPDGQWLVYSRGEMWEMEEGRMNLWIVPLDGSREAERLTTGQHWDANPVWFPSGDRIAFRSSRFDPGGDFQYLTTLELDPATGRPTSVPRQASLEIVPFSLGYQVSPDGQQLVYVKRPKDGDQRELKVIPWNGGHARTIWLHARGVRAPVWPGDGYIYFQSPFAPGNDEVVEEGTEIWRVSPEGGQAEMVSRWPEIYRGQLSPDAKHFLYRTSPRGSEEAIYELATTDGRRLASFVLPENMTLANCFTVGVSGCLATTEDLAAPLKVIPLQGGPTRQITETRGSDWPAGWSADGGEVLFESELNGTKALWAAPLSGGPTREIYRMPPEEWLYGPSLLSERYILYGRETEPDQGVSLRLLDIRTGSEKEITRTPWTDYTRYNSSTEGGRFLYADHPEGSFEFRALSPSGESQLLRAFPDSTFPPILAVQGERIAYWVGSESEGESTLYLARAGVEEAKPILTFPGAIGQRGSNPPVWSPNGRYLATGYWRQETNQLDALVVGIDSSDAVVGTPMVIEDLPESWWSLDWLPSSDGFLVVSGAVWLASLDPEVPLVKLTDNEPGPIWTYALSPDGRYVAVAPEVRRGGSIWRLDLSEVVGR